MFRFASTLIPQFSLTAISEGEGGGVVSFYSPAVLRKSSCQSAVSFDTLLRFIKFFSAFLRFSQPLHSRLTIREERYGYNRMI